MAKGMNEPPNSISDTIAESAFAPTGPPEGLKSCGRRHGHPIDSPGSETSPKEDAMAQEPMRYRGVNHIALICRVSATPAASPWNAPR